MKADPRSTTEGPGARNTLRAGGRRARIHRLGLALGLAFELLATFPAGASEICREVPSARELLAQLGGPDPQQRRSALEALGLSSYCDPDFASAAPEIAALFSDPDPEIRTTMICRLAGEIPADLVLPYLQGLRADPSPQIRACAIGALAGTDAGSTSDFLDALGDESEEVRSAAVDALRSARLPPEDLPVLTQALADLRPAVRAAAAAALIQFGTRAPQEGLAELLSDPESAVRLEAAATLTRTGAVPSEDLFEALSDALTAAEPAERRQAAAILMELGPRARPVLGSLLHAFEIADEESAPDLASPLAILAPIAAEAKAALIAALQDRARRNAALSALHGVDGDLSESVPALIEILREGDAASWLALNLLGEIGPAAGEATPILIRILESSAGSEDANLRYRAQIAAETLGKIAIGSHADEARSALARLPGTGDPELAALVLEPLARLGGDRGEIVDRLIEQLSLADEGQRQAALYALESAVGDPALRDRLPALRELFQAGDPDFRAGVARILWEAAGDEDPPKRLVLAHELVADRDPEVRAQAALLVTRDAWVIVKDREMVLDLLEDPDRTVRIAGARALPDLGPDAREALSRLVPLLSDPERDVRLAAIGVLRELGPVAADALPALEELDAGDDLELHRARMETLAEITGSEREETDEPDLESQTPDQALMTAERRLVAEDRPGAIAAYDHALAGFRAGGDQVGEARALVGLGLLHLQVGHTDRASQRLEEARILLDEIELPDLSANVWYLIGHLRGREGLPKEAREAFERALRLFAESDLTDGEVMTQALLANLDFNAGETAAAETRFREIIRRSRQQNMALTELQGWLGLGEVQVRSGTLAEAHDTFSAALVKARQLDHKEGMATALALRGIVEVQQGGLDAADRDLSQARSLLDGVGNDLGVGLVAVLTAELQVLRGEAPAARRSAEDALEVFSRAEEHSGALAARLLVAALDLESGTTPRFAELIGEAERQRQLAVVAEGKLLTGIRERRRGSAGPARRAFDEARTLFDRMGDSAGAARVGLERFHLELLSGRIAAARAVAQASADTFARTGHRIMETEARRALAELDLFAGRPDEARRVLLEIVETLEATGARRPLASALHTLGRVETRLGSRDEARRNLVRSLAIASDAGARTEETEILVACGELELASDRPEKARERFETAGDLARELGETPVLAAALLGLGNVALRLGDLGTARDALEQAAALFHEAGSSAGQAAAARSRARLAQLAGDQALAAELFASSDKLARELEMWTEPAIP